jgi:hypothetical protein
VSARKLVAIVLAGFFIFFIGALSTLARLLTVWRRDRKFVIDVLDKHA